jgi:hypothetical protein
MKKILIVILLFFNLSANAAIRYVTPSGGLVVADGTSWATAFPGTSLQIAISSSIAGDEVWVMSGTYVTTPTNNRNIYFSMQNGVAVYGSFAGTEVLLSQRNFSCGFTSILSAEIGLPGNADNSYHVISNSSLNNTAILDGFTISGANANFDLLGNDSRSLGGGMLNNAANGGTCSPTIRNCLFRNNTAVFGGGIFDHGQNGGNASPVITNCIFAFNTATGGGGGIDNFGYNGNASPLITNSIFYSNTATDRAGAMYCWGGGNGNASPVILNSVFVNNSSVDGGGLVCDRTNFAAGSSGTATPVVRNSIFRGNTASGTGPQFYTLGGAGFAATYTAIDISNQNPPHSITGPGTGNIFTAPAFVNIADADGTDNCWLTTDDGLQLQIGSVGIDAGDNTGVPLFDIRNYNRINNAVVDMGAYELPPCIAPSITMQPVSVIACPGTVVNLTVVASGDSLNYAWMKGVITTGVVLPVFAIPAATAADTGSYQCVVTGRCGTVASNIVTVSFPLVYPSGTWLGITDNWATASNWSSGTVPTGCTDVIINSGTPFMPVLSANGICHTLTLNNGASVQVNSNVQLVITGQ